MSELNRRWCLWRVRFREQVAHRIPAIFITHPFEIVAAVVAALMSAPALIGLSTSAALIGLVGVVLFYAWAATLAAGAIATSIGLHTLNPTTLASGLQLAGGSFAVYSLAVVAASGWGGVIAGAAFIMLALVSLIRALHYRRLLDIQAGAERQEPCT